MDMTNAVARPASPTRVWEADIDPEILMQRINGCAAIESSGESAYRVAKPAAIGPVKAAFNGWLRIAGAWLAAALCVVAAGGAAAQQVVFERDAVPAPLSALPADAAHGKAVFVQREKGHCILCHTLPDPEVRFAGNVGPPMAGVGARLGAAQMRARIVDPTRNNPETVMPAYFRTEGLRRVARNYAGRTALSAQDIEDVIAYLLTLR